jgi:hypothetical protein
MTAFVAVVYHIRPHFFATTKSRAFCSFRPKEPIAVNGCYRTSAGAENDVSLGRKKAASALAKARTGSNNPEGVRSAISCGEKIESPIIFSRLGDDSGNVASADGYEATTLIEVCDALIQARNEELLAPSQAFLTIQAEIIVRYPKDPAISTGSNPLKSMIWTLPKRKHRGCATNGISAAIPFRAWPRC